MTFFEWDHSDRRLDFIPGVAHGRTFDTPDYFNIREAPRTVEAPTGPPSVCFDKERQTVVMNCRSSCVNFEQLRHYAGYFAGEQGRDAVRFVEVLVSAEVQVLDGPALMRRGFDRIERANDMSGLFCWRKEVRWPKKKEGG